MSKGLDIFIGIYSIVILLAATIIFSFFIYYTERINLCKYDPSYPCWADWKCAVDESGNTAYVYSTHFQEYYTNCLYNTSSPGPCNPSPKKGVLGASGNPINGTIENGCNLLDYLPYTNQSYVTNTPLYPGGSSGGGDGNPPLPYPCVNNANGCDVKKDNKNFCAQVPSVTPQ